MRRLIHHYETQTDEEAIAEDEAAFEDQTQAFIEIPNELLPPSERSSRNKPNSRRSLSTDAP